jgi:uncharacterized protein
MAVQVTLYLTEGDSWHHRPLHLEILKYLREESVFGAAAFHAVAGFLGRDHVHTAHLVEAGGELPVVVIFVDTDEHVSRVMPKLKEMAAHRLIVLLVSHLQRLRCSTATNSPLFGPLSRAPVPIPVLRARFCGFLPEAA